MIEIIKAIIYGIVEGITEWLPISSTGHLILLEKLMPFSAALSSDFFSMFEVVIQLGAILAVVVLFWNQIFPFHFGKEQREKKKAEKAQREAEERAREAALLQEAAEADPLDAISEENTLLYGDEADDVIMPRKKRVKKEKPEKFPENSPEKSQMPQKNEEKKKNSLPSWLL